MLTTGVLLLLFATIKSNGRARVLSIWSDTADRINIIIFGIIGMLGVQYAYFMSIKSGNAATATLLQ